MKNIINKNNIGISIITIVGIIIAGYTGKIIPSISDNHFTLFGDNIVTTNNTTISLND